MDLRFAKWKVSSRRPSTQPLGQSEVLSWPKPVTLVPGTTSLGEEFVFTWPLLT